MNPGEWLLHGSAWVAFAGYALGEFLLNRQPSRPDPSKLPRLAWTFGCLVFLVHVATAFAVRHHWSHAEAYVATAKQTKEFTGLDWGGGLWFNYFFALTWLTVVTCWWKQPALMTQPRRLILATRVFFYFMWFNATVIFIHGPQRWLGLAACLALASEGWRKQSRR